MISRLPGFICLVVCILYSFTAFARSKDKDIRVLSSENYVLILSSYQYDNPWATTVAKKIQRQLEKENPEFVFRIVYASLDVQQTMLASRLNMQKAFAQARLTPKVLIPRILVLIGDESWMLYRIMDLRGKWEKVPVVLCGVHGEIQRDYADFFKEHSFADSLMIPVNQSMGALGVTGVLQKSQGDRMATLIRKTFPALKEMVYISNGSYNDEYNWHQQKLALSALLPQVKLSYFNSLDSHKDSICQYVNRLSPDSAALLFYSQPSFTGQLQIPAYSLCDWESVNNNVVGGYYASSDRFAAQAASLVMRIYKGEPMNRLPFRLVEDQRFWLNAQASCLPESKWRESDLPGFAYYDIPPPFLIRHLRSIGWFLLGASMLVIGVVISLKTRRYQHHIQSLLAIYRELHEKYQAIYDNVPIALLIFNERGDLRYENPVGKKLLQSWYGEIHDHLNLFDEQFMHPRLQEKIRHRKNISQVFSMQDGIYLIRPSKAFLDSCEYFRLVVRYIPDETGNGDNILMMLVDNTEIYRTKVANKRIHNVLDFAMGKASISVAEYNLFGKTGLLADDANRQAHDPSSASFWHIADEDRERLEQFYQQAIRGESGYFNEDIKVVREDGSIHYLRKQIKVMEYQPENRQIWVAELEQDIDKEKEYVAELQMAIHKAAEGERLKNTFIANMSHEIRSPLNAIVGFSNLMGTMEEMEARQGIIHYIEENNEILLRQVNDIVELSKMESGSMTLTLSETNMNELLQDAIIACQFRAAPKNIRIESHFPLGECHIMTDKVRIRQVVDNFLSNAIKYTGQDGLVSIEYRLENKMLSVQVTDTGVGIPKKELPNVFGRFFRAHKEFHGFGLGLSIARAVIEGLKGNVGVESEEGKGSTFWFRIPVEIIYKSLQVSLEADKETASVPSGPLPHMLVVEDDESSFLLIQFMLKNLCRITHAKNEAEAVQLFRKEQPDLILMNVKVPKKSGYRVVPEIRALSPGVPIIAITAFAFSKDENRILENGFNGCLAKPLDRLSLLKMINKWLNNAN